VRFDPIFGKCSDFPENCIKCNSRVLIDSRHTPQSKTKQKVIFEPNTQNQMGEFELTITAQLKGGLEPESRSSVPNR